MTAHPPAAPLLTATEFGRLPDDGSVMELKGGKVIRMPPSIPYHGLVCGEAYFLIRQYLESHPLGRALTNDSGVITERDPDTVRGADVAFYSFARLPADPVPRDRYLDVLPELVVEVRSTSDRWARVLNKVSEYLTAGVGVVVVLDPASSTAMVYREEGAPQTFGPEATLTLPDVFPDFAVTVRQFFP